jgi:hypothetical protein
LKQIFVIAALVATTSLALAQRQPTCDPNDPNCNLTNGCNGGRCVVSATSGASAVHRHGKKAVKR